MIVTRRDEVHNWAALLEGQVVGSLRALTRPDGRCYLFARDCTTGAYQRLLDTAVDALGGRLYAEADEDDEPTRAALASRGFTVDRHEHRYVLQTDPQRNNLASARLPNGFAVISAAAADMRELLSMRPTEPRTH